MNAFEFHGITRLSPSTLNHFATEPAHWVMARLLRSGLPAAVRGGSARTVGELWAAGGALWKSIADDQRKTKALTQLLDLSVAAPTTEFRSPRPCPRPKGAEP